jgi:hypothetical protein
MKRTENILTSNKGMLTSCLQLPCVMKPFNANICMTKMSSCCDQERCKRASQKPNFYPPELGRRSSCFARPLTPHTLAMCADTSRQCCSACCNVLALRNLCQTRHAVARNWGIDRTFCASVGFPFGRDLAQWISIRAELESRGIPVYLNILVSPLLESPSLAFRSALSQ